MDIQDINALLDNTATIETKIIVLPTEDKEEIVLTQDDSIVSWEYADKRYVPDKGIIGMFVERTLEGSLMNITPEFNIENRELELQLGVRRNDNGEYKTTFYSLGNFIVSKPGSDEVQDNTKYNAKDYTIKFNVEFNADYTDNEFTESFNNLINSGTGATAEWLARYTCKQVGVELADTDFANSDFVIFSNQFQSGDQCRDVMKAIGKLAYSWVRIGWDNKCHIDYSVKKEVTEEYNNIGKDNYYKLEVQKNTYGEVNKVVLGSSVVTGDYSFVDDKESIAENGETKIVINDNPILYTENLRLQALPPATRLFGLKYTPLTIETTGHPWLNGDDMISVIDRNGDTLYTYPFDRIISYGGHIRTTLSTYSDTEVEQEYTYEGTSSAVGERRQTRLELDRENQRIDAVVERQDKTEEQVAQFSVTLDEILSKISDIESITIEGRTNINNLMMNSLFGGSPLDLVIHPIGGHIDLTYPTYTIYPSSNTFGRVRSYLKIENLDGSYLFEYDLPELLYLDENNYDEFEIEYENKRCFKTKRVKFDENKEINLKEGISLNNKTIYFHFPDDYNWVDRNLLFRIRDNAYPSINLSCYTENDTIIFSYYYLAGVVELPLNKTAARINIVQMLNKDTLGDFIFVSDEVKNNGYVTTDNENYGRLIPMETLEVIEYDFPTIEMTEGDYKISVEDGYDNVYIYGKFVEKNDYTNLFATKVELNSAITQTNESITAQVGKVTSLLGEEVENLNTKIDQTADSITSEVSKTYATKDELGNYSTTTEMNSAIKQSADSITETVSQQITDIDGKVQAVEGNLDLYIKKKDTGEVVSAFNLATNQVTITSDNFKLTADGKIECKDALITGGKMDIVRELPSDLSIDTILENYGVTLEDKYQNISSNFTSKLSPGQLKFEEKGVGYNNTEIFGKANAVGGLYNGLVISGKSNDRDGNLLTISANGIDVGIGDLENGWDLNFLGKDTEINPDSIRTQQIYLGEAPTASNHAVRLQDLLGVVKNRTIDGLNLGADSSYQLSLPPNTIFIEPLFKLYGGEYCGGMFLTPGAGFYYFTNNDNIYSQYKGVYIACNYDGLVTISSYNHNGTAVTGFRIWYLGL